MLKKLIVRICTMCVVALAIPTSVFAETVGLFFDSNVAQIKFAANDIKTALESKNFRVEMLPLTALNAKYAYKKVVITLASDKAVAKMLQEHGEKIPTGLGEQAYSLRTTSTPKKSYWVLGGDANGAMYGGLQIAENIKFNDFSGIYNNQESPAIFKRGIKLNYPLDANSPTYGKHDNGTFEGISYKNAIPNIWDMSYWTEWFDEMARNRYNVVSVWLCHPFTSLIKMDEYPDAAIQNVTGFNGFTKTMTIDQKIAFWQEVMAYGNGRGFDFYFFNWNLFTYGANDKYGITNSISNTATVTYMYKSMMKLLETYPHLSGFGLTAGEKMTKDRPANEKFLWDTYGKAIYDYELANPTRKFHFIHRLHFTTMAEVKKVFLPLSTLPNVNYSVSFKYSQAHMYACATPKWWDSADESELLSSGINTWFTIRNDDFYYHNWGDPAFVRTYINEMPGKTSYLNGFYMGSDGYCPTRSFVSKNSVTQGILDIKRQWYMYMLMGRLSYNPNTSDDVFKNYMKLKYGGISSTTLFDAWQKASRGIPKMSELIAGKMNLDFHWWPEGCHFGRSKDSSSFVTIDKIGSTNVSPGSLLCNFENSASNNCKGKKSTYEVANEIETDALDALNLIDATKVDPNTELGVSINNIRVMSYLTVYYAYKIRAATDKKAGNKPAEVTRNLGIAYCWWMKYANLMDQMYYGMTMQRLDDFPNWHHQDANVLKEYNDNGGVGIPKFEMINEFITK